MDVTGHDEYTESTRPDDPKDGDFAPPDKDSSSSSEGPAVAVKAGV
jgi:hypothetical protein